MVHGSTVTVRVHCANLLLLKDGVHIAGEASVA